MKKLRQNDLFNHIDQFLKDKGIEIREAAPLGSRLKTGCQLLTETINHAQGTLGKARDHMDDRLDKMRNIIHEKTAPKKTSETPPKRAKKKKQSKKSAPKKTASAKSSQSEEKRTASKATNNTAKNKTALVQETNHPNSIVGVVRSISSKVSLSIDNRQCHCFGRRRMALFEVPSTSTLLDSTCSLSFSAL